MCATLLYGNIHDIEEHNYPVCKLTHILNIEAFTSNFKH